ncbi:Exportin-6 [Cladochytrium tenue]|nr:Exportin-6 [Cladochytrium tenue]
MQDRIIRWGARTPAEKAQLRQFLWGLLAARHATLPPIALNKLIKLVVDIGKEEFPDAWPQFFADVVSIGAASVELCLRVARTAVEEFLAPGSSFSVMKRLRLKRGLDRHGGEILTFILPILKDALLHQQPTGHAPETGILCELGLVTASLLFSSIPLSEDHVVTELVEVSMRFAQATQGEHATLGLSVINELFARNYMPPNMINFLLSVSMQVCALLKYLTDKDEHGQSILSNLDEEWAPSSCFSLI